MDWPAELQAYQVYKRCSDEAASKFFANDLLCGPAGQSGYEWHAYSQPSTQPSKLWSASPSVTVAEQCNLRVNGRQRARPALLRQAASCQELVKARR